MDPALGVLLSWGRGFGYLLVVVVPKLVPAEPPPPGVMGGDPLLRFPKEPLLSLPQARFLLGAVLDATYSLNATYSVDVNASVANRFPDAPWPWAGTSSKFVITMNTNRPVCAPGFTPLF